jgi:hypothetical protein
MKPYLFSIIAAAAAIGFAQAETAYTTPVGYVTSPLAPNQFNLISMTVHNATVSAGVIDGESASPNSITDNEVDFTTLLTAGATYILELPNGLIQEVTSWSGSTLNTPQDITGSVIPATTTYKLRKAATVSDVFGATNSAGLTASPDGDPSIADTILIYNGVAFDTVYYYDDGSFEGWFDDIGNPAENYIVNYADGLYVKRVAGSTINLVVTGEVKTVPTSGVLSPGFNYLGAVAPVGLDLDGSGLQNFISQSADGDPATVDNILIPDGAVYRTCYYFNDGAGFEGWFDDVGNPAGDAELSSGFLIFNRGGSKSYTVAVPAGFSSL